MEVLTMKWHRQHRTLEFYCNDKQRLVDRLPNDHVEMLEAYLKKLPLTVYMFMPLKHEYIMCYRYNRPYIQLIIDPNEVIDYVRELVGADTWAYYEEVAVAQEEEVASEENINVFFKRFYSAKTLGEAERIYHTWQEEMLVTSVICNQVITLMEFYYEEIFIYFLLPEHIRSKCFCT